MEGLVYIGIIFLIIGVSCYIQWRCIKAKKKIWKVLPVIFIAVFAGIYAFEYYKCMGGGDFFGAYNDGMFDALGIIVIMAFVGGPLVGISVGVVLAWIAYAIKYMIQKRKEISK